jgi:regulatory protein
MDINITKCIKKGNFYLVSTNKDCSSIKMHQEIVFLYGLTVNKTLPIKTWQKIKDENEMKLAWTYAMNLLSARSYTESNLLQKLKTKKFSTKIQNKILKEAKRLKLINDKFFAKQYSLELHNKGFGIKAIKVKLFQKGITEHIIENTLFEIEDTLADLTPAKILFDNKLNFLQKRENDIRKLKEKMYRFMMSKGFSYEIINDLIDNI